jgi:hypothetical protein
MASCKALHKGKARAINVPENSTVPVAWLRLSKQHRPRDRHSLVRDELGTRLWHNGEAHLQLTDTVFP